jgi:hypothetical protein
MTSTEAGMQIDFSEEQEAKSQLSRQRSLAGLSKKIA